MKETEMTTTYNPATDEFETVATGPEMESVVFMDIIAIDKCCGFYELGIPIEEPIPDDLFPD